MTEEERKKILESPRGQWRARFIEYLIPRLSGTDEEKLIIVDLVSAALSQAHVEGTEDAAEIIEGMADAVSGPRKGLLATGARCLRDLANLNRKGMEVSGQ